MSKSYRPRPSPWVLDFALVGCYSMWYNLVVGKSVDLRVALLIKGSAFRYYCWDGG